MCSVACYNKKRTTVKKSQFISTENMRQNCNGVDPYNDVTSVDGIEFSVNDILIANIRPYLKKAWKAEFNGACSTDVLSINPTGINSDFLFHCIEKDDFFNYVMSAAKGSKMPRGDKQHIMEYTIPFPSEPEQKKISAFIELLTQRITSQCKLVESLKLYKRGVCVKFFSTLQLTSTEVALREIASIYQPQTISTSDLKSDGKYPVYGANGLIGYYDKFNHEDEQIAICCRGASCGTVNYTPRLTWITGNAMVVNINNENANKRFVYHQLATSNLSYMISGSGQPQIVKSPCENHRIFLPDISIQSNIAQKLDALETLINKEEGLLSQFINVKSGLLQQMFI